MTAFGQSCEREDHQLDEPQGACDEDSPYQRVVMCFSPREDMLHDSEDIRLVEIEITEGESQEDEGAHDIHEHPTI
jgi:hypothetical protein